MVLIIGIFLATSDDKKKPATDKQSEQSVDGTEDTQVKESTEENWFGVSEEREVFSDAVEQKLSTMTTEQKVAQLFLVSPEALTGVSPVTVSGNGTRTALQKYPVAGLIYSEINFTSPEQANLLISGAQGYIKDIIGVPLFILMQEEVVDYVSYATARLEEQDGKTMVEGIWTCTYVNSLEVIAAIEDGANMIYAKENFVELYEAVLQAVNGGTITQVRLENAVGSVLTEKMN